MVLWSFAHTHKAPDTLSDSIIDGSTVDRGGTFNVSAWRGPGGGASCTRRGFGSAEGGWRQRWDDLERWQFGGSQTTLPYLSGTMVIHKKISANHWRSRLSNGAVSDETKENIAKSFVAKLFLWWFHWHLGPVSLTESVKNNAVVILLHFIYFKICNVM